MPGNALKELVTQKNCSSTRMHDGSGAKPLIMGLWYGLSPERASEACPVEPFASTEVRNMWKKVTNDHDKLKGSIVQVQGSLAAQTARRET